MLRVYVGCFGSGLGHAARMLEIAALLSQSGADVEFSSSGEVTALIRERGYRCNNLPLADVRYSEDGAFSLRKTMIASPSILARAYHQGYLELANIKRFRPQVVLSDSALSTAIAGKSLRLPVFTVLNQLSLTSSHGQTGAPSRLLSVGISAGIGKLWELSDEVLLPDLPPPYTISEMNLWGSNVSKTRYIGFLTKSGRGSPDPATKEFTADRKPKIFWQVSGPPGTRVPFLRKALRVAEALSDRFVFIITEGSPTGNNSPLPIPGGWRYEWCTIPELYFDSCDVVVSRAGHGTISQAITSSKPSLLVPIPRQPEQVGNARKAERLGVAARIDQDDLSPDRALDAIEALLGNGPGKRAAALGRYAQSFKAAEEVVRTVSAAAM